MVTHQVNSAYSGVTKYPESLALNDILQFNPTSTGRSGTIMTWTVPLSGKYKFTVAGAEGGKGTGYSASPGKGIIIEGTVDLKQGEIVRVLVGQQGGAHSNGGGGGGGSFTAVGSSLSSSELLVTAGGGGGSSLNGHGASASGGMSGTTGPSSSTPSGGTGGYGGYSVPAGSYRAGSGGGFYGDGQTVAYGSGSTTYSWETATGSNSYAQGGRSFRNGGTGGYATSSASGANGGFGGGGGNGYYTGGGGGGYSGGAAGNTDGYGGGGGGSAISTIRVKENSAKGYNTGHGYVTIQLVQLDSRPPTVPANLKVSPSANNVYLTGETISISWDASTDPDGDVVMYDVDFYNGSSWVSVASKITDLSADYVLPNGLNTATAKIRVRAVDNKTAASAYQESEVFTARKQLLLIQDGDSMKTYANGAWTSI